MIPKNQNLEQKKATIRKPAHAFKGYASSHNVEILNSFNLER